MGKPVIEKTYGAKYAIRPEGKKSRRWAPEGSPEGSFAEFETRAKAEKFIAEGGLIKIEIVDLDTCMRESGWNDDLGFTPENIALFQAYLKREGIYYYGRPREEFSRGEAERLARKAGLSKLALEDLS